MHSASGRFVTAFNGEIYNHLSVRSELDAAGSAPLWRGRSDTETLLAAIEAWGLVPALRRCVGMFALVLVDRRRRHLYLARDRFGEKPLYWGLTGSGAQRALVFGSELAALRAYPGFDNPINRQALAEYLRFGHVPTPFSMYAGVTKLPAGHCLSFSLPLELGLQVPTSRPWWEFSKTIQSAYSEPLSSEPEALHLLENTLSQAIADQAIADVPLGAFLSGGIDSSLVTALLQRQCSRHLRTFTIGFEEAGFNEAPHARAVAAHLGTDHAEVMLTSADAQALIPQIPQIYNEPFADSSQLPTYLVCREARRAGLTVALSGDGGDELFGGYNRYFWGPRIWKRMAWLPLPIRRSIGSAVSLLKPSAWDAIASILPVAQFGHKAHKLATRLQYVDSSDELYRSLVSEWHDPSFLLCGDLSLEASVTTAIDHPLPTCLSADPVARMMAWDALGFLPDDILVKLDRAAMSLGLETRAPFLDHRVAAVAWRLPKPMKIRGGTSKWALRQILYKYVPRELIERPKAGFAIPIGQWLRGPLRAWADELLHPDRLLREGYLRPEPISQLWHQHLSGRYDHTTKLWTVLMWQAWLEQWG
jgi:asparagine synthase (glutamine-hydrolysing)